MNILMIAYLFPPDSTSGSFRSLHFARHLQALGENVFVLTAREQDFMPYQAKDPRLLENLDERITLIRTRVFRPREAMIGLRNKFFRKPQEQAVTADALDKHGIVDSSQTSWFQQVKDTITDILALPDPEIGWFTSAVKAGRQAITHNKIDVIYVTGSPWSSLLIGWFLKKLTRKPLVVDFRDPWVANPIFLLKSKLSRTIEAFMERKVVTAADHIVTNTEELKQDFLHRYPFLTPDKLTAITNGFETYILKDDQGTGAKFTLLHAGTLIFRNPKSLLQAAINLIEQNIIHKNEIQIVFLGGISMQDQELDKILHHPVLEKVLEILPRVPYQEAVEYQKQSHVLFLMQPEEFPLQIPRKFYDYIAFQKPILGIAPQGGATARIIQENHLGIVVTDQTSAIESALKALYQQWKNDKLMPLSTNASDTFTNRHLTMKLLEVFRTCTNKQYRKEGD